MSYAITHSWLSCARNSTPPIPTLEACVNNEILWWLQVPKDGCCCNHVSNRVFKLPVEIAR
jgi:hypothetical protein